MTEEVLRNQRTPRAAPYVSWATFQTLIEDLRRHGVPGRIDRSVLTRFSGIVGTQLIGALKFLELVDDAASSTPRLRALVEAWKTPAWPRELSGVLRHAYAPLFALDLAAATPSLFHETFKTSFPAAEAVLRKCAAFFLRAARDAGVTVSPRILKGTKPRTAVRRNAQKHAAMPAASSDGAAIAPPSAVQLLALLNTNAMTPEEQNAVWTLIRYIKKNEPR